MKNAKLEKISLLALFVNIYIFCLLLLWGQPTCSSNRRKTFIGLGKPPIFHSCLIMWPQKTPDLISTHALHTYRINLSPFTKDFRVWGALIENTRIYLRTVHGWFTHGFIPLQNHQLWYIIYCILAISDLKKMIIFIEIYCLNWFCFQLVALARQLHLGWDDSQPNVPTKQF